ncbi:MAG: ATP-binding protein, partial [Anaerolineae bacterium]
MYVDITDRKQRERELEAMIKVAETVRTAHTRADLAPVILAQVADLFAAGGVALTLVDAETGESYTEMGVGVCDEWTDARLPPGVGVTGHVIQSGEPYFSEQIYADPLIARPELVENIQAAACVPLVVQEERLGVLWVCRDTAVTGDEMRLLTAIADIVANAIQRATLYEQSLQDAANLEKHVAERTQELAEANERLQELDKLKSKFVSDVSHELRTPITNIKLYLDLLVHGRAENSERYITILQQQSERLTRLVEDTLALSRLDGADAGLWQKQWVDLNQIAGQVVAAFQAKSLSLGLELTFNPAPDLPKVWAEPNQLTQVVTNLVTNALNYTPEGSVAVGTAVASENDGICLMVKDTGIGIPPEDRQHLFDRFYRGHYAGQSAIPGTGLGLSIVKEIMDLHGGRISFESNNGQGAIFRICLPIAENSG